jgi:membrane dipeptidase
VVGVTFVDLFSNRQNPQAATLDDVVAQIEYLLSRVGPEHVSIGSDFDGCTLPQDIQDATSYPQITQRLVERGDPDRV